MDRLSRWMVRVASVHAPSTLCIAPIRHVASVAISLLYSFVLRVSTEHVYTYVQRKINISFERVLSLSVEALVFNLVSTEVLLQT